MHAFMHRLFASYRPYNVTSAGTDCLHEDTALGAGLAEGGVNHVQSEAGFVVQSCQISR